jgi:hypothetical protein
VIIYFSDYEYLCSSHFDFYGNSHQTTLATFVDKAFDLRHFPYIGRVLTCSCIVPSASEWCTYRYSPNPHRQEPPQSGDSHKFHPHVVEYADQLYIEQLDYESCGIESSFMYRQSVRRYFFIYHPQPRFRNLCRTQRNPKHSITQIPSYLRLPKAMQYKSVCQYLPFT